MPDSDDYDEKPERDGDDDHDSFQDSSEEGEEEDKYEKDDFLVDDEEEEDGEGNISPPRPTFHDDDEEAHRLKKKKKKKRRHHDDPDLAEGDILLLEERGIRGIRKKRLKRLRKGASDEERDDEIDEDFRDLSRDDEEDRYEERRRRAEEPVDYDDDMDDFIDDGGRSNRRRRSGPGFVSSEVVRTARSIFGDIDEISHYQGTSKPLAAGEDGDDEDDEDYDVDADRAGVVRPAERGSRDQDVDEIEDIDEGRAPRRRHRRAEDGAIARGLGGPLDDKEQIENIIGTDIPEQLQYHAHHRPRTPTETQLRDEANWIYRKGFLENPRFTGNSRYESDDVVEKIVELLSFIHISKLDIPFVAMYRQDYVSDLLIPPSGEVRRGNPADQTNEPAPMPPPRGFNSTMYDDLVPELSYEHQRGVPPGYDDGFGDWSVLWLVLDLDKKYADLTRRKDALFKAIDDAQAKGVPGGVLDDVRTMAQACDDEKELYDGERHLRLSVELAESLNQNRIADDFDEENDRRDKRPSRRRNRYTEFCKRGYRSLTKEMGINARQFGDNLKGVCDYGAGSQVHVPIESESDPIETAKLLAIRTGEANGESTNVGDMLAERVLSAARFILVTEITSDLAVLQATRRILCRPGTVTVSTIPTLQGIAQVDDTHPLRGVTSLSERKIESFRGTPDYALIRRAVDLGFTSVEIAFRPEQVQLFRKHLESSILVETSASNLVDQWNEQRLKVVGDVHKILVKSMLSQVKDELDEETSHVLRNKLMNAASRRFLLGPARPNDDDGSPRVLSFCVTSEEDEEPDPLQSAKDTEDAKTRNDQSKNRVAPERITIVDVDENGEYNNGYELFASWLRRPLRNDLPDCQLPGTVKQQLKSMIVRSRAQVIVIGVGSGRRAPIRLSHDICDLIKEMVKKGEELPAFLEGNSELVANIKNAVSDDDHQNVSMMLSKFVILCDEAPCRIYAKSNWAAVGLSVDGMTLLEKRAIGLARLAQEPLWVYCAIGQENELAARLQFHTYHFYAKPADRVIALKRALIRAVCTVGVDINRSLRLPHTQSMVAYVGGLGVHKASALLKELGNVLVDDERGLISRKHLCSQNYVGRIVFVSAAAFLRVRDPELHPGGSTRRAVEVRRNRLSRKSRSRRREDDGALLFDPRDDSRIHPEHYMIAGRIADEALRDDSGGLSLDIPDSDEYSEELRMTAAVLDNPKGLKRLDLQEYARHLVLRGRGSLFETVKMIADEFNGPYRDHRCPLQSPDSRALFYLVTGADPMLLRIGSAVTATNCLLRRKRAPNEVSLFSGISCMLPDNIRGFIKITEFSDKPLDDRAMQTLVPDGSSLTARIIGFTFEKFEADLCSKVSVVNDPTIVAGYVPVVDKQNPAFRPYPKKNDQSNGMPLTTAGIAKRKRDLQRKETMSLLKNRSRALVHHPSFNNVSGDQAAVSLRSALPGDILIRPSQYSKSEIVFSCKFASLANTNESRTLLHIPCRVIDDEGGVDGMEVGEGNCRYKIEGVTFEHVDQALDEYVRPILSNLSEAIDHRKFLEGSVKDLCKEMENFKKKEPGSIPYCIGLSEKRPRNLVIVFIPGSKSVVTEEIEVVPNGYKFRQTLHIHIDKLIMWFKQNMRKVASVKRVPSSVREPPTAAASIYHSPFAAAASPFRRAASPFRPASSPYHAPTRSPAIAKSANAATLVKDVAPPPVPGPVAPSNPVPAPYGFTGGTGQVGANHGYVMDPQRNDAPDWSRATRQQDDPPPMIQNGNASMGRGIDNRRGFSRNDPRGNFNRGPGRNNLDMPMQDRQPGIMARGPEGNGSGGMPSWRGRAPIPAWKKQQEAENRQ